jgi:hypothetical protein
MGRAVRLRLTNPRWGGPEPSIAANGLGNPRVPTPCQATRSEPGGKRAAQRSECRDNKVHDRRMSARRKMLEPLQNGGIDPEEADDPNYTPTLAVCYGRDQRGRCIGCKMLKLSRDSGTRHVLSRK